MASSLLVLGLAVELALVLRAGLAWRALRRRPAGEMSPLSVIIPLKGWDAGLPALLESLGQQEYPAPLEILLVIDDDHPQRQELPPHVLQVHPEPRPGGWLDKNWRLKSGLEAARHRCVLFLDSDTVADRHTVARRVGAHRGVLSFAPPLYARPCNNAQRLLAAFTSYHNLLLYGAGFGIRPMATAVGPSLLLCCERSRARQALEAVRGEVADDHALGFWMAKQGDPPRLAAEAVEVAKGADEGWRVVVAQIVRWLTLPRAVRHLLEPSSAVVLALGSTLGLSAPAAFLAALVGGWLDAPWALTCGLLGSCWTLTDALLMIFLERSLLGPRGIKTPWRHLLFVPLAQGVQPFLFALALCRRRIRWRGEEIALNSLLDSTRRSAPGSPGAIEEDKA